MSNKEWIGECNALISACMSFQSACAEEKIPDSSMLWDILRMTQDLEDMCISMREQLAEEQQ